jgi:hypothetical protein
MKASKGKVVVSFLIKIVLCRNFLSLVNIPRPFRKEITKIVPVPWQRRDMRRIGTILVIYFGNGTIFVIYFGIGTI